MSPWSPSKCNRLRHLRAVVLQATLAIILLFTPFFQAHAQGESERLDCDKYVLANMNCILEAVNVTQQTGQGNQEKFTLYSVGLMAGAIGLGFAGTNISEAAGIKPGGETPKKGGDAGAINVFGRGIAFLYEKPPASLGDYVADIIQNNNLVRPVYAQGVGFQSLTNILPIWKTFRDIAYLLMTIIFFFIGFFIIFRQKLDGHTVANISNAIPNIIIALLLINFSYAIAGFMIDLMYLVIYFIIWIAGQVITDPITVVTPLSGESKVTLETIALTQNLFSSALNLTFGKGENAGVQNASAAVSSIVQAMFDPSTVGALITGVVGAVAQVIAFAVFAVALFFAVMRTFFELVKAYISFIIAVIFSPLQLLAGAISGRSAFINWIKTLAANLTPFPLIIGLLFLSMALTGYAKDENVGYRTSGETKTSGFNPPLLPFRSEASGQAALAIQAIIGFGILMFMPEAVKMSKEFFKVSGGPNLAAVGEGLKKGWSGGEIVPGLGIKAPGAKSLLQSGGRMAGSAIAGGTVGGIAAIRENRKLRDAGQKESFLKQAGRFAGYTAAGIGSGLAAGTAASVFGGYRQTGEKALNVIQKVEKGDEMLRKYSTVYRKLKDQARRSASTTTGATAQQNTTANTGQKRKPTP